MLSEGIEGCYFSRCLGILLVSPSSPCAECRLVAVRPDEAKPTLRHRGSPEYANDGRRILTRLRATVHAIDDETSPLAQAR
jgi:hypothetical protein